MRIFFQIGGSFPEATSGMSFPSYRTTVHKKAKIRDQMLRLVNLWPQSNTSSWKKKKNSDVKDKLETHYLGEEDINKNIRRDQLCPFVSLFRLVKNYMGRRGALKKLGVESEIESESTQIDVIY